MSAYLGESDAFDTALARFAVEYADQTSDDLAELRRAVDRGIIEAHEGI